MIQRENTETLQAGRQHTGKAAGRDFHTHTRKGGVSVLALLVENWLGWSRVPAETLPKCLGLQAGILEGVWAEPWSGRWGCSAHPNTQGCPTDPQPGTPMENTRCFLWLGEASAINNFTVL